MKYCVSVLEDMVKQKTIGSSICLQGHGIHSNLPVELKIKPAPEDTGIVFHRVDQDPHVIIKASVDCIAKDTSLRQTTLSNAGCSVKTTEHLLAALYSYGVSNAIVEVDQEEMPALDGGSKIYCDSIEGAGVIEQSAARATCCIDEKIIFSDKNSDAVIEVLPSDSFKISYSLSYDSENIDDQHFDITVTQESFYQELASARTFCLKEEAEMLRKAGFGKGATFENTLVFEKNKPIQNTLLYPNEAVRHKILDVIGDFSLLERDLCIHIIAKRTGHVHNMHVMKALSDLMSKGESKQKNLQGSFQMTKKQLDITEIQGILPHRFPFLLVDRVLDLDPGKRAVAIKNVTVNERFFCGHFPGHPIMPGVLIIEAMAQVGGIIMLDCPENKNKMAYFMSIDNAKFRKPVTPGDQVRFEVEVVKWRSRYGQVAGKAYVDDALVCQADLKFSLVDK